MQININQWGTIPGWLVHYGGSGEEGSGGGLIALHTYYVVRIVEVCFSADRYLALFAAPAGL